MRFIEKKPEPVLFSKWKQSANENWTPSFDNMSAKVKNDLKQSLIREQLGICCYCECELSEQDSHIEHFRPRATFQNLSLDYNNLLCSCQSNLHKGDPSHCGNAKGNWFSESLLISPLSPDCASHFRYTADGHIYPADSNDVAAKETIDHLALDCPKLVASRKLVLDVLLDPSIPDDKARQFVMQLLDNASADCPQSFISAISSVFLNQ